MGNASRPILEAINRGLASVVDKLMPLLLFLVGAALTADGLVYLFSAESL
jgi:small neutral amino acid transporter SnatA (MarC family)